MKIFVSGIAGFLGSHLADAFIKDGHHVVGCDSLIGGELSNVPAEAEFYQYDCCYRNSMLKITKGCDLVYHTAATAYEIRICLVGSEMCIRDSIMEVRTGFEPVYSALQAGA